MNRLFSTESSIYQTLTTISSIIWMTVLWLFSCMPVLTIGAATAAYYRMLFDIHEEKPASFGNFYRALAANFGKGTLLWLLELVLAAVLAGLYWIVLAANLDWIRIGLLAVFSFLFFLWATVMIYGAPLLSYFENSLLRTMFNALAMGIRHYRQTVFSLALSMLPVLILLLFPYWFLRFMPFIIVFGTAGIAYAIMCMMETVFRNYIP